MSTGDAGTVYAMSEVRSVSALDLLTSLFHIPLEPPPFLPWHTAVRGGPDVSVSASRIMTSHSNLFTLTTGVNQQKLEARTTFTYRECLSLNKRACKFYPLT